MLLRSTGSLIVLVLATQAVAHGASKATAIFLVKPDGSEVRKVAQVEGHDDHEAPRWSHDGRHLVFDARNETTRQRSCFVVAADGTGLREVARGRFADWSPDDKQIAFQLDGPAGAAEIYVQNLDGRGRVKIADGRSPRWSPDGGLLAYSDRTMLRAADLLSDEQSTLLPAPVEKVFDGFAWSPDGSQMAVVVRPAVGSKRHLRFVTPTEQAADVASRLQNEMGGFVSYSPDGKQLVFSDAMLLRIVDVEGEAPARKIPGQTGLNRHPAFSPDGKWIAYSGSLRDRPNVKTRAAMPTAKVLKEVRRHDRRSRVWSLDFTPDGRKVVLGGAGGNGPQVWDLTSGETRDLGGRGMLIYMFPDGRRFATSWVRSQAHIIDIESGEVLREINHGGTIWAFHLSSDGRRLLTGGLDKVIRIWDTETGEQLKAFEPTPDYVIGAIFTPDGKEVVAGGHDQKLRVWDVDSGQVRLTLGHPAAVWGLAVTHDGRHILSGTGGSLAGRLTQLEIAEGPINVVRKWDRQSGKLIHEMKGHTGVILTIDVSPDGRLAASGSSDGTLRLWDLTAGKEISRIGPGKGCVASAGFTPDGNSIVVGGGVARIKGRVLEIPDEQIRVFRVLDADPPAPPAK